MNVSETQPQGKGGKKAVYADQSSKPTVLAVNPAGIPAALKELLRWVLWLFVWKGKNDGTGKWDKVPMTVSMKNASSTDQKTWVPFDAVYSTFIKGKFNGIGFVLGDGFAGIDLDDVRDPATSELVPWAAHLVSTSGTYCEVSPSGTGVKLFGRGVYTGDWHKRRHPSGVGEIEVYSEGRYFTVTGHRVGDTGELTDIQPLLDSLARLFDPKPPADVPPPPVAPAGGAVAIPDADLITLIRGSKQRDKFDRLWIGETGEYGGDESRADLALCSILGFWCGPDAARIDRLFRQSGLMRPKWDEKRKQSTYGADTIRKALAGATEFYHGPSGASGEGEDPRPVVWTSPNLYQPVDQVRQVVAAVPDLFARGNVLVQSDPTGALLPVLADALPVELTRHVRFVTRREKADGTVDERQVMPPANICRGLFADPRDPIRQVVAVVGYPTLLPDGRILADAGYDPLSRALVTPSAPVRLVVPDRPSAADARRAAERLLDVFKEFPFPAGADGERSKSAILALMLTLVARPLIAGPTPFFLVQKNAPGAGGTLLLKAVWRIVAGTDLPVVTYTHDEVECRKLLTALTLEGRSAVAMDNIDGEFGTPSLCRFVSADEWSDRVLGGNKMMTAVIRVVMFGSANNAELVREMPRRTVPIDLYTEEENPAQVRKERPDLLGFIDANRSELLSGVFVILKAWLAAGRPQPAGAPQFGSFEGWSAVVRAAVVHAGQPDPYTPTTVRDDRRRLLQAVAAGLREIDPAGGGLTAAEIVRRLSAAGHPSAAVRDACDALAELTERVSVVAVGKLLAQCRNRNLGGVKIVEVGGRDRKNMAKWTAQDVTQEAKQVVTSVCESPAPPVNGDAKVALFAGDAGDVSRGGPTRGVG